MSETKNKVHLRPARTSDLDCLFKWRNEFAIRQHFFHPGRVTKLEHKRWLDKKLRDPKARLFIIENHQKEPIGQLRLDRATGRSAEISVAIDPSHQGSGNGRRALALASSPARRGLNVRVLVAHIKSQNIASTVAFLKAGFVFVKGTTVHGVPCYRLEKKI